MGTPNAQLSNPLKFGVYVAWHHKKFFLIFSEMLMHFQVFCCQFGSFLLYYISNILLYC